MSSDLGLAESRDNYPFGYGRARPTEHSPKSELKETIVMVLVVLSYAAVVDR